MIPDPRTTPTISIEEAARHLSVGRSLAYELARTGRFPVPVLKCGRLYRVPVAPLLTALGLESSNAPGVVPEALQSTLAESVSKEVVRVAPE